MTDASIKRGGLRARAAPIGAVAIAMVSVQVGASVAKGLFPEVGPLGATALRVGLAVLMMLALWRPWRTPLPKQRWPILAYGAVLGAMNLVFYQALARIPLGIAVAVEFTGPLTLALLGSRKALDFLWIGLAVAGLALLLPFGPLASHLDPFGVVLALVAGVCWALYIVFGQKAGAGGQGQAAGFGMVVAALVVLPFGAAQAAHGIAMAGVAPKALLVALLTSVIPYSLEMLAMARLPARVFGVLMSAEPAVGAVSGFLILGERLSAFQCVAVVLIIAASAGVVATHRPTEAVPEV
ncbi:MAG: EamA family transporter [Caulobacteraceae bacterium]